MKNFRPKPFYFINTADPAALTLAECRRSMQRLHDQGFGGCVLFNKPPVGFTEELYLSDRWLDAIENFIIAGELKKGCYSALVGAEERLLFRIGWCAGRIVEDHAGSI